MFEHQKSCEFAQIECDESKGLGTTTSFHCVVFAGCMQNQQSDSQTNDKRASPLNQLEKLNRSKEMLNPLEKCHSLLPVDKSMCVYE